MIAWVALAYFCGSIPFGLLIARAATGKDVRTVGSGNIGATNVARAAGKGAAVATMILDAAKGLAPVLLAPAAYRPEVAIAAVVGHCFPVWLRFRGGKGVATGFGVCLALAPWAALAGGAAWVVLYKIFRISSAGSLAGVAISLAVAAFTADRAAVWGMAAVSLLIVVRHAGNIRRLLRKQES